MLPKMNLSTKQEIFLNFLIKRIGFLDDSFLTLYLYALGKVSRRFKVLGSQHRNTYDKERDGRWKHYELVGDYYIPDTFDIFDFLNYEVKLKNKKDYKLKKNSTGIITATDIANFTYCPVSFSIGRTFHTKKIESAIIGTSLHEKNVLFYYLQPFKEFSAESYEQKIKQHTFGKFENDNNRDFINDIKSSTLIYSGHADEESKKKYFSNSKKNFYGQPDYIFKSNFDGKIFVVEEKFQFVNKDPSDYKNQENFTEIEQERVKKRKLNRFFSNHENQVNAYVHGIMDPVIDYGYLVYWKYEMDNGLPEIIACSVKKILKNDESKSAFGNAFQEIHKLIKQGKTGFNINDRSHLKCASCVTGVFCGHKTGRFSEITFPYDLNFLKLKYVEFPEELKKEKDVETGNHTSKLQI